MHITLLYISGKKFLAYNEACADYCQRVRLPWRLEQRALTLSKMHGKNDTKAINQESDSLLRASESSTRIVLDSRGKHMDSTVFAEYLHGLTSRTKISCLVGGPSGLNEQTIKQSHLCLSLSAMTLPHPIARLMLCEQIYRASTIIHGGTYHK